VFFPLEVRTRDGGHRYGARTLAQIGVGDGRSGKGEVWADTRGTRPGASSAPTSRTLATAPVTMAGRESLVKITESRRSNLGERRRAGRRGWALQV
jgi:hypothetical protein